MAKSFIKKGFQVPPNHTMQLWHDIPDLHGKNLSRIFSVAYATIFEPCATNNAITAQHSRFAWLPANKLIFKRLRLG
jgi:hypothetical protein